MVSMCRRVGTHGPFWLRGRAATTVLIEMLRTGGVLPSIPLCTPSHAAESLRCSVMAWVRSEACTSELLFSPPPVCESSKDLILRVWI